MIRDVNDVGKQSGGRDDTDRIQVLTSGQPGYPAQLKEIRNYPKTIYYLGDPELLRTRCVAVVGSRTTTVYGRNAAKAIAGCLARQGITVVAGMAAGIDTCAHEGTLSERGKTIAVLGSGPDICYPASNRQLKKAIEDRGLVISEYPPGTGARSYHFPQRNRIISGLSELVVVVQARMRSGALITAEMAAEQGREVCAVPGNIDSQYNLGTNRLIRDGVTAITAVEDVLEPLGLSAWRRDLAREKLSDTEYRVYRMLEEHGEMSPDEICAQLSCQPGYLIPILTALELKGCVCSAMGKFFLAKL